MLRLRPSRRGWTAALARADLAFDLRAEPAARRTHPLGDEASFPQWGSLSYTWARRGEQPTVKTSGKRKGYKVFGMIEFWTGKFFSTAIEGRFTSETYAAFVTEVMSKARKHLIIVQDGARYHTSKYMRAFFAKHAD